MIKHFFEPIAAITRLAIEVLQTLTRPAQLDVLPLDLLVNAISDMIPTKDEKGEYFCYPSRTSLTSSSATNHCRAPTTSG